MDKSMSELEPTKPEVAKEMYLAARRDELAAESLETHDYNLRYFCNWCDHVGLTDLNDLSGRDLHEYRLWRKETADINSVTMQSQLSTVRVFLRYCESIDAVADGVADKMILPSRSREDGRQEMIDANRAEQILSRLRKFEYATRDHVLFLILWRTGMRTGAVQSLDLGDYHPRNQHLELRHRPDTGTTLKNGKHGERFVGLTDGTCEVLDDYIDVNRADVMDDYGRPPLFTTEKGRPGKVTIRRTAYRLTRPCEFGSGCPHDRDPSECEAAESYDRASACPSTVSAHPIRRGSITHHLLQEVPENVVGDRVDVSADVLDAHYDERTEQEKMEQRRAYLDNI